MHRIDEVGRAGQRAGGSGGQQLQASRLQSEPRAQEAGNRCVGSAGHLTDLTSSFHPCRQEKAAQPELPPANHWPAADGGRVGAPAPPAGRHAHLGRHGRRLPGVHGRPAGGGRAAPLQCWAAGWDLCACVATGRAARVLALDGAGASAVSAFACLNGLGRAAHLRAGGLGEGWPQLAATNQPHSRYVCNCSLLPARPRQAARLATLKRKADELLGARLAYTPPAFVPLPPMPSDGPADMEEGGGEPAAADQGAERGGEAGGEEPGLEAPLEARLLVQAAFNSVLAAQG